MDSVLHAFAIGIPLLLMFMTLVKSTEWPMRTRNYQLGKAFAFIMCGCFLEALGYLFWYLFWVVPQEVYR